VSQAIKNSDQNLATEEKTKIEAKQRESQLERRAKHVDYASRYFTYDSINKEWLYNYADLRPWDPQTDLYQYEAEFKINTKTKINLNSSSRSIEVDVLRNSLLALHHPAPRIRHALDIVGEDVQSGNHQIISNSIDSFLCRFILVELLLNKTN
jgi:hypothetical protein